LNQVCFDETEPSEETSVRMLKLSNFYKFENQPALESSKRRAVISASASPLLRERRSRQYDAFVTDFVAMRPGNRHQRRSSGSFQASMNLQPALHKKWKRSANGAEYESQGQAQSEAERVAPGKRHTLSDPALKARNTLIFRPCRPHLLLLS